MMSRTICSPELKTALSPVGSQLKMSENLNPNQPVALEAELECLLRHLARLRSLDVSISTWEEVVTEV